MSIVVTVTYNAGRAITDKGLVETVSLTLPPQDKAIIITIPKELLSKITLREE